MKKILQLLFQKLLGYLGDFFQGLKVGLVMELFDPLVVDQFQGSWILMQILKLDIHPDFVQDSVQEFPKGFLQNLSRISCHQDLHPGFGYLSAQDWKFVQDSDVSFELNYFLKLEHVTNFASLDCVLNSGLQIWDLDWNSVLDLGQSCYECYWLFSGGM